jgi:hypothetical protein
MNQVVCHNLIRKLNVTHVLSVYHRILNELFF